MPDGAVRVIYGQAPRRLFPGTGFIGSLALTLHLRGMVKAQVVRGSRIRRKVRIRLSSQRCSGQLLDQWGQNVVFTGWRLACLKRFERLIKIEAVGNGMTQNF